MLRSLILIGVLLHMSTTVAQEFSLKRNNFSFFLGNTHLDCRVPVTGYTYGDINSNFYNEQFEIRNQSMKVNPGFGAGYSRRAWQNRNEKLRTSILMLSCDLSYSWLDYRRTKVGAYAGGITQYFFEGTVEEQFSSQFLALGLGAKYFFVTPVGEVFGVALGIERNKSVRNRYSAEYRNKLDNTTWVHSPGGASSQMSRKQRIRMNLTWPQDYFSFSICLSAGKKIGKTCHAGVFAKYIAPEYLFYSNKKDYETNGLSFIANSRYLTYFNIINYGIYIML